jgi:hypothetical protein
MPLNLRRYTAAIEHDLLLAKTQSGKARIAILQLAAFLFLALSVSFAQAQSLVNPIPLQNTAFEYRVLPYEATVSGFINQANTEGATRFLYGGNYVFSSIVSIYSRPIASNITAVYSNFPRPTSAAALVATLNTQGAAGNFYLGDYGIDDSLLVKYSGTSTYSYRELPLATTEVDFLAQINAQGAQGYAFLGNVGFPAAGGAFVFSSLYVRNNANSDVFNYETRAIALNVSAFLTQVGAQGLLGYRYQGDLVFSVPSTTSKSLFVKNLSRADQFFYEALNVTDTVPSFLTQANAMGARKYLIYGNVGLGNPTSQFASIYISLSDVVLASGFE